MQKRISRRVIGMLAVSAGAVLMGASAPSAKAALILTLSEPGFMPATYIDLTNTNVTNFGGPLDYGTFTTEIVVGSSNLNYQGPTPSAAVLQIQSLQVVSTTGTNKTLTISLTQTGYNFPGNTGNNEYMDSSLGGTLTPATTGDVITFDSTATTVSGVPSSNVSSGLQVYSVTNGINTGTTSFQEPDANTAWNRGTAFDLTNVTMITMNTPGEAANLSGTTTVSLSPNGGVPEPTAAGVIGMLGLGRMLLGRRRRARGCAVA